jgi:DNA-binding MurR/RpiR family transcriptional regulator
MVAADRGNLNRIVQKLEDHERARAVEKLKTDACRHVSFGYVEQSHVAGAEVAYAWSRDTSRYQVTW